MFVKFDQLELKFRFLSRNTW